MDLVLVASHQPARCQIWRYYAQLSTTHEVPPGNVPGIRETWPALYKTNLCRSNVWLGENVANHHGRLLQTYANGALFFSIFSSNSIIYSRSKVESLPPYFSIGSTEWNWDTPAVTVDPSRRVLRLTENPCSRDNGDLSNVEVVCEALLCSWMSLAPCEFCQNSTNIAYPCE